jgi:hypothetical protein
MRERNIIFLDFNGVIETTYCRTQNAFDPYCIAQLKEMIDDNTDIVVTSNWRIGKSLQEIKLLFKPYGIFNIVGVTPALPYNTREEEIKHFIKNAPRTHGFIVNKYIVLDDEDDYVDLHPHVLQTQYQTGITHEICQQAKKHLV